MYSEYKSIQILVALLKEYEIQDIILSPGGSDIPLIHSIETDEYFKCYSVVDERSAAYFAMGVSQQKNRPVACICTSGTAVCNYVPGITEAFYQSVPVLAITCDKNPDYQGQLEMQKIVQDKMFSGVVKKEVTLPIVKNEEDYWVCNRLCNEAMIELTHHGLGPCHINVPIVGSYANYDCDILPKQRVIKYQVLNNEDQISNLANQLHCFKKIMVVVGQNLNFKMADIEILEAFFEKYNCIFAVEHLSNLKCKGCIYTYPITETEFSDDLIPDLVISIGNNLAAYGLKPKLRAHYKDIVNWLIIENGEIRDSYKSLQLIFEMNPISFFKLLVDHGLDYFNDKKYFNIWKEHLNNVKMPDFEYSNFYVAKKLSSIIPQNSILHLAILNSTRVMQFFDLNEGVKVYSNVGALGIDGCLSSFAGQAASTTSLAFLLIGDLSFFYDMNAAGLRDIGPNVRIILMNNGGGSEFHFFMGKDKIPTINDYICAEHSKIATGWIASLGFDYYPVSTKEELDNAMVNLDRITDKPQFIEVFGDMEFDAIQTRKFYNSNKPSSNSNSFKEFLKKIIPAKQMAKAKKVLQILKEK